MGGNLEFLTPDAVRVPTAASCDEQARRRNRDRTARGNLAALACQRFGVDPTTGAGPVVEAAEWFADLAEILGLDSAPPAELDPVEEQPTVEPPAEPVWRYLSGSPVGHIRSGDGMPLCAVPAAPKPQWRDTPNAGGTPHHCRCAQKLAAGNGAR